MSISVGIIALFSSGSLVWDCLSAKGEKSEPAPAALSIEKARAATSAVASTPTATALEGAPFAKLDAIASFDEAVKYCLPFMEDMKGQVSAGALLLESWGRDRMRWEDVAVANNETSIGKIRKDPDAERGRRMCVSGTVVNITKVPDRIYAGILGTDAVDFVRFDAVGSTGEVVRASRARFCGVVTGILAYKSSVGDMIDAVHMVGMFDLPENKRAR